MEKARLKSVELEYETVGTGEPLLLITCGPIAGGFLPLMSAGALQDDYQLIRYHRRGMRGSTSTGPPTTFAEHAADAAELLGYLGVPSAHVVGHSTGALVGLQLALDHPRLVHSLALLEPPLIAAPGAAAFMERVGSSAAKYAAGDREAAMADFLSLVSGLEWGMCAVIDEYVPRGVAQAVDDADNFFGSELPALNTWHFGSTEAETISQPVLSVLGTQTEAWFVGGHDLLHSWFPQVEDLTIGGVGHLLHMQRPNRVAQGLAEFLARHRLSRVLVSRKN